MLWLFKNIVEAAAQYNGRNLIWGMNHDDAHVCFCDIFVISENGSVQNMPRLPLEIFSEVFWNEICELLNIIFPINFFSKIWIVSSLANCLLGVMRNTKNVLNFMRHSISLENEFGNFEMPNMNI